MVKAQPNKTEKERGIEVGRGEKETFAITMTTLKGGGDKTYRENCPPASGDNFVIDDIGSSPARDLPPAHNSVGTKLGNDSFGLPLYVPLQDSDRPGKNSSLTVPWSLRKSDGRKEVRVLEFLRSPQFWRQVEFALRVTLIAVFPSVGLVVGFIPLNILGTSTSILSAIVLASKVTVGEMIAFIFTWLRAGCIWLPFATCGVALGLGNHIGVWCAYYTLVLFVIATFTENMVRRVCLLLFNICMIGLLVKPDSSLVYPSRVMADWCIGTLLCALAVFVPYPIFSKTRAQKALCEIANCTGAAFTGMTSCFWSPSNVERNMSMTKVRMLIATVDEALQTFYLEQDHSFYEFLFDSGDARRARWFKAQLFERLRTNLIALSQVLDMVEGRPWVIDESERSLAFGQHLSPHIKDVAASVDKLMDALTSAHTIKAVSDLDELFTDVSAATRKLQHEFNAARLDLFYQHRPETLEEFVPLMTYFMFTIINSHDTISQFGCDMSKVEVSRMLSAKVVVAKVVWEPFKEEIEYVLKLFRTFRRREIQRLIEAAKVSAAMIATVGFSLLIGVDKESLSGPSIIAFVSGSNPVEAVQASVVRLTACILGTVIGFFAGTYSSTPTDKIISVCVLMFIGTFFRTDKDYGILVVYAMFVLIPLNTMESTTTEDTLSRMNQITFGILIYIIISAAVFPLSPSLILRKKRINILIRFGEAVTKLCGLFSKPLTTDLLADGSNDPTCNAPVGNDSVLRSNISASRVFTLSFSERLIVSTDSCMEEIDALLNETSRRLKRTVPFEAFARKERGLLFVHYPTKACERTAFTLNRMMGLLRSMWCSWSILRSQKAYTPEMRHILRTLQPIALDASSSFNRFVDLMCYALRNPTTALQTELMQAVLDFMQSVEELCLRKNHIMIAVITKAVNAEYGMNNLTHGNGNRSHRSETLTPPCDATGLAISECARSSGIKSSALPLLRKKTFNSIDSMGISGQNIVSLSDNFVMPISGEDSEGLHALSLSLSMFSNDAKLLLMSLEEMLDHMRKTA